MKPSELLRSRIDEVRAVIARFPVRNPRIFGSVARGEDDEKSDLDLLVDPTDSTDLYTLAALELALEDVLGIPVDIATPGELRGNISQRVDRDVWPL